jgi:PIN domain nuclease of toxin-antitoxin system
LLGDSRLSRGARKALRSLEGKEQIGLAAISLKEAAWHLAHRRIVLASAGASWAAWLREASAAPNLQVLPLTVEIAIASEQLPDAFPRDPADRLIAATARVHDLTLLTADAVMRASSELRTLW